MNAKILSLTTEYTTPYNAFVRDEVVMGVPRYFIERWLPVLGIDAATIVNTLRQLDYRCTADTIEISGEALAHEASMSRRHLYTCLDTPWMSAFVRHQTGDRQQNESGQFIQQPNRYQIRMDDPLTPADADRLVDILTNLADTPIDAAARALERDPRDLWAADPTTPALRFTEPRAITARDVLQRAFPLWEPATDEQAQAFSRAAEALHRHLTLIRQDGRAAKIIVPQYFRRRWWSRLGHERAWIYLYLRGCVYDGDDMRREMCWVPALEILLKLIGRPREWWRRNIEHAQPNGEGWSLADFFTQTDSQKGRNPAQPQWVARQFRVALEIPIAPEDRAAYERMLATWNEVRHTDAHRDAGGPPNSDTPESAGSATRVHTGNAESATLVHTGIKGVCHTETQGSATLVHTDSESLIPAPDSETESLTSSKHPENVPAAAAEKIEVVIQEETLFDRLTDAHEKHPEMPLCLAAPAQTWLQQAWPEPVRPHTPAWTSALSGQLPPRDLVALILAVWCDPTIKYPPRYLSWLVQRWQHLPDAAPVSHWDDWRRLADLPLQDWPDKGRARWVELAPPERRDLPFGLDLLAEEEAGDEPAAPELPADWPVFNFPIYEPPTGPDGLDNPVAGGDRPIRHIWQSVLSELAVQLNTNTYEGWVKNARAVSYLDGTLTVLAPSLMAQRMLSGQLSSLVSRTLQRTAGQPVPIRYVVIPPSHLRPQMPL